MAKPLASAMLRNTQCRVGHDASTRTETMKSIRSTLAAVLVAGTLAGTGGCSMCCSNYDYAYPTFGGRFERADPYYGRVGSTFSDPNADFGTPEDIANGSPSPTTTPAPTDEPTPLPAPSLDAPTDPTTTGPYNEPPRNSVRQRLQWR
jgi:hypothetical protein